MKEFAAAAEALRKELAAWLKQTRRMDPPGPHGGGEDEANYCLAWFPYYLAWHDPDALAWFDELFEALCGWVDRECVDGYEPKAEAHHGPEPFLLFLPRYAALAADPRPSELLDAAARNVVGGNAEVPAWYDASAKRFRSWYLGTREVRDEPAWACESAEHLRFVHLALAAWRMTGHEPYRDWALDYGAAWAKRLTSAPAPMPLLWDADGQGLSQAELQNDGRRRMAAENHHVFGDPLAGIENLLASGAVQVLADLFDLSGDQAFQVAARRIVVPLVPQLSDPYADPASAAVMQYRMRFRDGSSDSEIRRLVRRFPAESEAERLAVVREQRVRDDAGVGRRNDMLRWARLDDDGRMRWEDEPCTAALALAWQVTGEVDYATRALRQASQRLNLARRVLRGGREHADMGGSIAAVAQGHGRNWGVGAVTGCLGPLLLGATERLGAVNGRFELANGLPEGIASLVRDDQVTFQNVAAGVGRVEWRVGEGAWRHTALLPGTSTTEELR